MVNRLLIAYACEREGSEPGVGFHWAQAVASYESSDDVVLITRRNNKIEMLTDESGVKKVGIDLPESILWIKTYLGVRFYYLIWTFLVLLYLVRNYWRYRDYTVHHITFTPVYFPPVYFIIPFRFIWGPVGGGERYPLSYLSSMRFSDAIIELIRLVQVYSIYVNPLFYIACYNSVRIIASTKETARMFPRKIQHKVFTELMVFDEDKELSRANPDRTIVIANRLINWKMTHLFVEAFSIYARKHETDYQLIIIGDGRYQREISDFCDNKRITHKPAFRNRCDMFEVLRTASLFASMSLRDSGAASVLEAASFNIPFVVTNVGAHREFLGQGIGFGVDLESYNVDKFKIVELLEKLLGDERVLVRQRSKLRECYKNFFSREAKYDRIKKILDNV